MIKIRKIFPILRKKREFFSKNSPFTLTVFLDLPILPENKKLV